MKRNSTQKKRALAKRRQQAMIRTSRLSSEELEERKKKRTLYMRNYRAKKLEEAAAARLQQVMAGDVCRTHLLNITRLSNEFESKPKKIEGNLITDWFNAGENLFEEFYNLGTSVKWNSSKIKKDQAVVDVVTAITRNQGWLQSFLSIYPGLRVDAEGAAPAAAVCRVRSGLELLLRGLAGLDPAFDAVLRDLQDLGELDEFDHRLKIWTEGHRPDFFPGDLHPDTPETHWWWF